MGWEPSRSPPRPPFYVFQDRAIRGFGRSLPRPSYTVCYTPPPPHVASSHLDQLNRPDPPVTRTYMPLTFSPGWLGVRWAGSSPSSSSLSGSQRSGSSLLLLACLLGQPASSHVSRPLPLPIPSHPTPPSERRENSRSRALLGWATLFFSSTLLLSPSFPAPAPAPDPKVPPVPYPSGSI